MHNQPIGILDSGVGGLSIWKEIINHLPHESTIYIADSKNCPYGTKSSDEIYGLAKKLVQFLVKKKVKLVVIACNTITVSCLGKLRHDFPDMPIVGAVPVVKTAREKTKSKKVAVLSTSATAKSFYQKNLIEQFAGDVEVKNIGIDILVPFVERGELIGKELDLVLRKTILPFTNNGLDVLALGCSHFPFLKDSIQKIVGKNVLLLDSGGAIARQVERVLTRNNTLSKVNPKHLFFTTGNEGQFKNVAATLIGGTITGNIVYAKI